jgi:hypothetical protein
MLGCDDETHENATSATKYVIGGASAGGLLLPSRTSTLAAGDVIYRPSRVRLMLGTPAGVRRRS